MTGWTAIGCAGAATRRALDGRTRSRRRWARTAPTVAVTVAFAFAGCAPEPPSAPATVRLLDLAREAHTDGVPPDAEMTKEGFAFSQTVKKVPRRAVRRLEIVRDGLDAEARQVLVALTGSRYRFTVTAPERPRLRVALALPPLDAEASVRFRVTSRPAGGAPDAAAATVLDEYLLATPEGGFFDREVELPVAGGEEIELVFETALAAGDEPVRAGWGAPELVAGGRREPGWDLILVSLDTVRADRLGCYGYRTRPTTPWLDAFAGDGVRFANAVSQSPWTRPSHRAMLSGVYPVGRFGEDGPVLARLLRDAGFRTEAITGGGQMDFRMGFAPGFERYRVVDWIRDLEGTVERFEATSGRRRFLFLHTYEPHDPYGDLRFVAGMPRGRIDEWFGKWDWERLRGRGGLTPEEQAYVEALYDGDLAYTDERLRRLFAELEARGHLDRAIVVITSDHGEQFFEHGSWRHGMNLYDHQLMVPLLMRLPEELAEAIAGTSLEGRVVDEQVELVDLLPTLFELLEVPVPEGRDGRSLVPLLAGGALAERPALVGNVNLRNTQRRGLRTRRWKYVRSEPRQPELPGEDRRELYDLESDPGEHDDLVVERAELAARFAGELERLARGGGELEAGRDVPEAVDPDLRRRLEALGYAGGEEGGEGDAPPPEE